MSAAAVLEAPVLPASSAGKPLPDLYQRVWRRVRDEGGWWTASELSRERGIPMDVVLDCMRDLVVLKHFAQRTNKATGLQRIGVTQFCTPPMGEQLEPKSVYRPCQA